jgi:Amt family ammonium transporter
MWGAIATGIFCFTPVVGLVNGGGFRQIGLQLLGVGVTVAFAFIMTIIIGTIVNLVVGLRVTEIQERDGLDITIHGERGYHL